MEVEVGRDSRPGCSTEIGADVDPIGVIRRLDRLGDVEAQFEELGSLLGAQVAEAGDVALGQDEGVS